MATGLYIQQSFDNLGADSTSLNNHIDCQIAAKITINSSSTAGSFTAPFFEADETSDGSWYPFNGINLFTLPGTTTAWNRPYNTVHVTKFTIATIIGSLWFRPQIGKTVCIIDINKDYVTNQTTITMLSSPTTSVEFFYTGMIPQTSGNFFEMYKFDPYTNTNEIIFNELGLKRSYKVREISKFFVSHITNQLYNNTICNGLIANRLNYNPTNDPYRSIMSATEFSKAYINTSSVYNYYNNASEMRGVCVKFMSDKSVYTKYWDRSSGIKLTFLTQLVPPITVGVVNSSYSGHRENNPVNSYSLTAFLAYFPNVF